MMVCDALYQSGENVEWYMEWYMQKYEVYGARKLETPQTKSL